MKKAFTLAEVLITLAIIGVVAAITIPSVIVNATQNEFKTGLRKAVSALNQSITINMAEENETPYDNENLFEYLQQHMSVMSSTTALPWTPKVDTSEIFGNYPIEKMNYAFYTTDGMRFEIPTEVISKFVHEKKPGMAAGSNHQIQFNRGNKEKIITGQSGGVQMTDYSDGPAGRCGSKDYKNDSLTDTPPCLILVDVNGDKKPTPSATEGDVIYRFAKPGDKLVKDIFTIIITDEKAIPFGVAAQRAMYQSRTAKDKKKPSQS